MGIPLIRRFTRAQPTALSADAYATDDVTGLTYINITKPNVIVDVLNDPHPPTTGNRYRIGIEKGAIATGRMLFSDSLNPASAGRMAVGPIGLGPGNYYFAVRQTAEKAAGGSRSAYSFIVKFSDTP